MIIKDIIHEKQRNGIKIIDPEPIVAMFFFEGHPTKKHLTQYRLDAQAYEKYLSEETPGATPNEKVALLDRLMTLGQ